MRFRTVNQVLEAFERASLAAGHSRNTRRSYRATVLQYSQMLKEGKITGPQEYFDYLATVKKLAPKSVWHALNPLKFLYEEVLRKEFGKFRLPKTEIYAHAMGGKSVESPLDAAGGVVIPFRREGRPGVGERRTG